MVLWLHQLIFLSIFIIISRTIESVKVVCAETNKSHDVMSTSLEIDDRDYVTEDDLRVGNELVKEQKEANSPRGRNR